MAPYQVSYNGFTTSSATTTTTWYEGTTSASTTTSFQITDNGYIFYTPTVIYYPQSTDNTYVYDYKVEVVYPQPVVGEAERRKRLEEEEQERKRRVAEYERMERERQKAEEKAVDCLLDVLGREQTEIYKRTGNLLVKGEQFDWLFDKEGKVYRCEKDKVVQLCLHSDEKHKQPLTDNVITLALHAKFMEKEMAKGHFIREIKRLEFKLPEAANF